MAAISGGESVRIPTSFSPCAKVSLVVFVVSADIEFVLVMTLGTMVAGELLRILSLVKHAAVQYLLYI